MCKAQTNRINVINIPSVPPQKKKLIVRRTALVGEDLSKCPALKIKPIRTSF